MENTWMYPSELPVTMRGVASSRGINVTVLRRNWVFALIVVDSLESIVMNAVLRSLLVKNVNHLVIADEYQISVLHFHIPSTLTGKIVMSLKPSLLVSWNNCSPSATLYMQHVREYRIAYLHSNKTKSPTRSRQD